MKNRSIYVSISTASGADEQERKVRKSRVHPPLVNLG